MGQWSLWKRYSDFERLCHNLDVLGIESDEHVVFPSKSWLFKSNNESLMTARRNTLNEYLKHVLGKYNVMNAQSVKKVGSLQVLHDFARYFDNHHSVKMV